MELHEGTEVFIPALGPGVVARVEIADLARDHVYWIRLAESQSEIRLSETLATALGVRLALTVDELRSALARLVHRRGPKRKWPERWLVSARLEDRFKVLQADIVGELPEDNAESYVADARRLLQLEIAQATRQPPASADALIDETLVAWQQWDATTDLVQAFYRPPVERAVAERLGLLWDFDAQVSNRMGFTTRSVPNEAQRFVVDQISSIIGRSLWRVVVQPIEVIFVVPIVDVDRHADILKRSERVFAAPIAEVVGRDIVFVCLYPSGAVRSASWTRRGREQGELDDPFALLDPDDDPIIVDDRYVHRMVMVGFELAA
jgi:hypothetical protein